MKYVRCISSLSAKFIGSLKGKFYACRNGFSAMFGMLHYQLISSVCEIDVFNMVRYIFTW